MARGTWIIVAAVAAVGIAAVVDALPTERSSEEARPATTRLEKRPRPTAAFDAAGVLYFTDELCRLRGMRLPTLSPVEAPEWEDCAFSLSPDGATAIDARVVWQPQRELRAMDSGGSVYVVREPSNLEYRLDGTAPAFTPAGALTFVRDGAVIQATGLCRPSKPEPWCERVLLTRRDLLAALGARGDDVSLKAIAWLTETRLVAAFAFGDGDNDLIAVYEVTTLIGAFSGFGGRVVELLASPRRSYVAARLEQPDGFVLLDSDGEPFVLEEVQRDFSGRPPFTGGRALAWSPDDAWTAIARRETVVFFRMGIGTPDAVHVALVARDLAWLPAPADEPAPDHTVEGTP